MSTVKRYFGMPWMMLVFITSIHTAVMLFIGPQRIAWLGAALALWPILIFFMQLMRSGKGRAPAAMKWPLLSAIAGSLMITTHFQLLPFVYAAGLGTVGIVLYDYWYSIMPSQQNQALAKGYPLPAFDVHDANGKPVSSQQWIGQPLLLLFIRGNWCPLCVAQVRELAADYQKLSSKGVRIVIVSAQPEQETRELAQKFSVPFEFYSDLGGKGAARIGIRHEQGAPLGMVQYSPDTVIPTVVICDAKGIVQYLDVADNYRDRPEPSRIFSELGV